MFYNLDTLLLAILSALTLILINDPPVEKQDCPNTNAYSQRLIYKEMDNTGSIRCIYEDKKGSYGLDVQTNGQFAELRGAAK